MTDQDARILIQKYLNGQSTDEEKALLETWYLKHEEKDLSELTPEQWKIIEHSLPARYRPVRHLAVSLRRLAAAVAILIALSAGIYFLTDNRQTSSGRLVFNEILPGGNKAVLTLPNGQTVDLSNDKEGIIMDAGKLTYDDGTGIAEAGGELNAGYAMLTTPRGGQYQVLLPDSSRVWLNAATTLKYPTSFEGMRERRVELNGEAYFEAIKNSNQPFIVTTGKQTVTVLGTHFNINSYQDEPTVKTTLLEGSVQVSATDSADHTTGSTVLEPRQQSILSENGLTTVTVNPASAIDWKNGEFVFKNEGIESIMRKLARWYNVSVEYRGDVSNAEIFSGSLSRFDNVSTVLEMLEETGDIRFKIKDRKILVYSSKK